MPAATRTAHLRRFLRLPLRIDATICAVVALGGWRAGWRALPQYGNALLLAGGATLGIGLLLYLDQLLPAPNPETRRLQEYGAGEYNERGFARYARALMQHGVAQKRALTLGRREQMYELALLLVTGALPLAVGALLRWLG